MSASHPVDELQELLHERIAAHDFPSAVYLIAERGQVVIEGALGHAVRMPEQISATLETVYDLASLTKPLVTGLLCARLYERKILQLDDRVAQHLPEFARRSDKQAITIKQLLTHTAGLAAWLPLQVLTQNQPQRVLEVIAAQELAEAPEKRVVYSDLGFITLGFLIERVTNQSLASIADEEIFAPLNLRDACFNPPASWRPRIAASEEGNLYESEMFTRGEWFDERERNGWRKHLLWGEVHDGNAFFLGGVAGHAGLFASARAVLRLAEQFLAERTEILTPETCSLFRTNFTLDCNEARSISWQLAATPDSTAGPSLPANSFGHTGFTGTSCWVDPNQQRVFILLTNRTHNQSPPFANINSVRRRFHSLAVRALFGTVTSDE